MNLNSRFPALAMILAASALCAQDTSGTLTGHITSKAGKPIGGATVRISSPALLGERTMVTDEAGQYRIALLVNGDYAITVTAPGFATVKGSCRILAGQISRQDATLTPSSEVEKQQSATVEVVDSTSQVDKTATVTQSNFSMDALQQITVGSYDSALLLSPGVVGGIVSDDKLKIRGGTAHGSKVLINGVTVTEEGGGYMVDSPTLVDMIESMAVIQSPLNARYGNTDGGIVSMITTKGSNTFSGVVRAKVSSNFWSANNTPYPKRDGTSPSAFVPTDDTVSRTYDVTLRGPLWKDHITFAYGSTISPSAYYSDPYQRLVSDPPAPTDASGTYYKDPVTGAEIRRANLFAQGRPAMDVSEYKFDQFVVFAQLGTNHQLEWNYSDTKSIWDSPYGVIDGTMRGQDNYLGRIWSLAYKGILSNNGVLDARFSRTWRAFPHPYSPNNPPIWLQTIPSYTPNPDGTYVANSLLQGVDAGSTSINTNGFVTDKGDTFDNDSAMVNYQHFLDAAGTHQIDVGFQHEKFQWNTQANGAALTFSAPGMISPDLQPSDIIGGGNPADYAGKYIVFNYQATQNQLDPTYGAVPVMGSAYEGLIPSMTRLWGTEDGWYRMTTDSVYLNDLWALNSRHSIMAGVRIDRFKVIDSVKTISSYHQPTLRFEYKWDLAGDQSRIVNFSAGQFHSRPPGSLFYPMAQGRLANVSTYYWDQGSGTPSLVDKAALLNPANYGYLKSQTIGGSTFTADPSWKAPISNEFTLGFSRAYREGGYWRATAVYKSWSNLYDFFPGEVYQDANGNPAFRRVLRNDGSSSRTYKSAELEWMLPLTKRFQFGGSYTYARLMTDARGRMDTPSRGQTQSANWWSYISTLWPSRDIYQPSVLQDPEHTMKVYLLYDLTSGKTKSSLALLGTYVSGRPEIRYQTYTIPRPTVPGYNDATHHNTGGLPTSWSIPIDGGRSTGQDEFSLNLKYNLEVPIYRTLSWFASLSVSNVFNTRTEAGSGPGFSSIRDPYNVPTRNAYGWRAASDLSSVGTSRIAPRALYIETGIRF